MMPRRGRSQLTGQRAFFVTTTVQDWERLFGSPRHKELLRDIIFKAVAKHKAHLFGYVLIPDHIHLLVELSGGGPSLSKFMQDVKSLSSRLIFPGKGTIWVPRFDDVAIYTEDQFRTKLAYIHNNPVKAGLVRRPEDYEYSSAKNWFLGIEDKTVCTDIDWKQPSGGVA
jgi:putative transposase